MESKADFAKNYSLEIVGSVASGKTTLAKMLSRYSNLQYFNTDLYTSNPFLKLYPKNRKKWSFITGLQFSYKRSQRIKSLIEILKRRPIVLDQGFDMGLYVYSKNCFLQGEMIMEEWKLLEKLHGMFMKKLPSIKISILLNIPEAEITKRIMKRGRTHEKNYLGSYIQQLNNMLLDYKGMLYKRNLRETIITYDQLNNNFQYLGKKNDKLTFLVKKALNSLNKKYEYSR